MDSEGVPEFIFDQGLYYPTPVNYYGYYCTGMESPNEWDDHHKFLGLDGQDFQFSGLQTESPPYGYYTPSYEYAQSPYNPYNPYIPGAFMGTDGTLIGTHQYINSPYQQTVSPSPYIPVMVQSGSDAVLNASPDPLAINSIGGKYVPPPPSVGAAPLKVPLEPPTLESFQSSPYQYQIPIAGRLLEGTLGNASPSFCGSLTTGSVPHMTQGTDYSSYGRAPAVHSSLKVSVPVNNGPTNIGSDIRGWVSTDNRPRVQYNGAVNRSLSEHNKAPRINRPRGQLTSPIALRSYPTKAGSGNLDGSIVYADQYNRDDFPIDYPDAKFFVIKSYSEDDVHKSIKYNVWSSTSNGNKRLDIAYEEAQRSSLGKPRKCPVFLFFSVNASGHFCGVAEMTGPVDFHKDMDFWLQDKWTGSFPVKWHIVKDIPNSSFRHIILVNNEYRPVTSSRDTQEIPYLPGMSMLTIFKNSPLKTSVLEDFMFYEERQRSMQEEKSRVLGRKKLETSVYLPAYVPLSKVSGVINQPPKTEEKQVNDTVGKEHTIKFDQTSESGEKQSNLRDSQDPKSEGAQQNGALNPPLSSDGSQSNGIVQHPKRDGNESNDGALDHRKQSNTSINSSPKIDGKQPNSTVGPPKKSEQSSANKSVSTDGRAATKHDINLPDGGKDVNIISTLSASPGSEADVVTVGSMQIKVNESNSSFPAILTIGSIPPDEKGLNKAFKKQCTFSQKPSN